MIRRSPLRRKTPLRSGGPLKPRAGARAGILAEQQDALDCLARAIVMMIADAVAFTQPNGGLTWWGSCEWCAHDGKPEPKSLQWAHIRARNVAPRLRWEPLNAMALCRPCHMGRWHDVRGLQAERNFLTAESGLDARTAFIRKIRTPEQIAWLASNSGRDKVDPVATARALFDRILNMTHGRPWTAIEARFAVAVASLVGCSMPE